MGGLLGALPEPRARELDGPMCKPQVMKYLVTCLTMFVLVTAGCGDPKPARSWQELEACLRLHSERPEGLEWIYNYSASYNICLQVAPRSDL